MEPELSGIRQCLSASSATYSAQAKKKPVPSGLRAQVFTRDGHACLRCASSVLMRLRADHVIPESKGGEASMDNLQTLCMSCNSWKGVQDIDFRALPGGVA